MNWPLLIATTSTALLMTIFLGLVTWANWDILKEDWVKSDKDADKSKH